VQRALDLAFVAGLESAEREARIRQARGLHQFGLADAELVQRGLQPAVVEQRDLHRRVGRQRLAQQLGHARIDGRLFVGRACPRELLVAQVLLRDALRRAEAAVGAEAGAAGEQGAGCRAQKDSHRGPSVAVRRLRRRRTRGTRSGRGAGWRRRRGRGRLRGLARIRTPAANALDLVVGVAPAQRRRFGRGDASVLGQRRSVRQRCDGGLRVERARARRRGLRHHGQRQRGQPPGPVCVRHDSSRERCACKAARARCGKAGRLEAARGRRSGEEGSGRPEQAVGQARCDARGRRRRRCRGLG
jgi:hypothetical protein